MDFSESRSKKASLLEPNNDVQTDDFVTLQDSNEFLVQGASNMFGMDMDRNTQDKLPLMQMIENPSSSDHQFINSEALLKI